MRTPIMVGNWKMNKTIAEALAFAEAVTDKLAGYDKVEAGVCAPFVTLKPLHDALAGTNMRLGAQNMHWEESGAFTGEVAPPMLTGLVDMIIVGHSERRQYYGETDETVNLKLKAALAHNLTPILCIGENLEQNEGGQTEEIVSGQVKADFDGIPSEQVPNIVIAYEPIWAIGTGKAATPEQANDIIGGVVRGTLASLYGDDIAQQIRIQYGGSMKPANVEALMSQPEIDGGLIGGASLKPESFLTLVEVAARYV